VLIFLIKFLKFLLIRVLQISMLRLNNVIKHDESFPMSYRELVDDQYRLGGRSRNGRISENFMKSGATSRF
jgi:hypothetical protein